MRGNDGVELINNLNAISMGKAARYFSIDGRPPDLSTLIRRATKGVVVGERRVFLCAVRLGFRWATSLEAVERFKDDCAAAARGEEVGEPTGRPPRDPKSISSARRRAEIDTAQQTLFQEGL